MHTPVLGYADLEKPFILEIDASHRGLGADLSQDQGHRLGLLHLQVEFCTPLKLICQTIAL